MYVAKIVITNVEIIIAKIMLLVKLAMINSIVKDKAIESKRIPIIISENFIYFFTFLLINVKTFLKLKKVVNFSSCAKNQTKADPEIV